MLLLVRGELRGGWKIHQEPGHHGAGDVRRKHLDVVDSHRAHPIVAADVAQRFPWRIVDHREAEGEAVVALPLCLRSAQELLSPNELVGEFPFGLGFDEVAPPSHRMLTVGLLPAKVEFARRHDGLCCGCCHDPFSL
jgi:hypothetical protein